MFNNAPKNFDQVALSSRKIIITAGNGVRVCKVKAYVDDVLYDVSYLAASPHDEDDNSLDDELYTLMRHKIEARLWTDDMTNLQNYAHLPITLTIQRTIREPAVPKRILTLRSIMTFLLMALDCFIICSRCRP